MSTTTLSTAELAELLDVTERQLRYVTTGPGKAYARAFAPETVRRLQVAASLAHVVPISGISSSVFPIMVRLVLDHPDEPSPPTWAVFRGREITYVHYRADLAGAVGNGAVVVKIDWLWPELPKEEP
jgi:hypothetical protein